jgi:hypothetical protein
MLDGRKWLFPCNKWFAKDEDDKKIERELIAIEQPANNQQGNDSSYKNQEYPSYMKTPYNTSGHSSSRHHAISDFGLYKIYVKTSDISGAGTNANVFIQIFGKNGQTGS